jgi:hypothetical protein
VVVQVIGRRWAAAAVCRRSCGSREPTSPPSGAALHSTWACITCCEWSPQHSKKRYVAHAESSLVRLHNLVQFSKASAIWYYVDCLAALWRFAARGCRLNALHCVPSNIPNAIRDLYGQRPQRLVACIALFMKAPSTTRAPS